MTAVRRFLLLLLQRTIDKKFVSFFFTSSVPSFSYGTAHGQLLLVLLTETRKLRKKTYQKKNGLPRRM